MIDRKTQLRYYESVIINDFYQIKKTLAAGFRAVDLRILLQGVNLFLSHFDDRRPRAEIKSE